MKNVKLHVAIVLTLIVLTSSNLFSQGNFTTEWESPAGWSYDALAKLNNSSNIYSLIFADINNRRSIRIYDGSTHSLQYSWIIPGDPNGSFDIENISALQYGEDFFVDKFDVNGDGINEIFRDFDSLAIINPVNGNVLFKSGDANLLGLVDIDGDNFVEILTRPNGTGLKIISTPVQTVSIQNGNETIKDYRLKQNYPNPFNPNTVIEYDLNKKSDVRVIIYDILGKEIKTLVDQPQVAGTYKLTLQGSDLTSGTYFYSLIVDGVAESKKMILIK